MIYAPLLTFHCAPHSGGTLRRSTQRRRFESLEILKPRCVLGGVFCARYLFIAAMVVVVVLWLCV